MIDGWGIEPLAVAVLALLWWAAKPLNRNFAEQDEAAQPGGFTDERTKP